MEIRVLGKGLHPGSGCVWKGLEVEFGDKDWSNSGVLRKASKPRPGKKPLRMHDCSRLAWNRGPRQGSPVSTAQQRSRVCAAGPAEKTLGGEWA